MNYLTYEDFFKDCNTTGYDILVAQTKKTFLIGPKINESFDIRSFILRTTSNCIYDKKIYNVRIKKSNLNYINKYFDKIGNNEVYELYKDKIIIHKILKVPEENYEEE